ncbi:MAG: hypothetical protein WBJ81_05325 [Rickettsiales bacterium]
MLLDSELYANNMATNLIGRATHYKAVTVGNALGNTEEQAFTYYGNCLKPFAPVHIAGKRDHDGSININWIRRSRLNADWRDNVDVPLGEESEKYQVDILDGDKIIRTLEVSTPLATYIAAEQMTDFKDIPNTITIKIYQLSALVGRGYPAIAII